MSIEVCQKDRLHINLCCLMRNIFQTMATLSQYTVVGIFETMLYCTSKTVVFSLKLWREKGVLS